MERQLKEITTQELEEIIGFDLKPKKEKKKANTVKVNEELYNELRFYKYLEPAEKGELLESIVKDVLTKGDYSFVEMRDKRMQKSWGDFIIMGSNKEVIRADVKSSTTYKEKDRLSMDYEYYQKDSSKPYIPLGADDNKGYLLYLKADMIIAINTDSKRLYIVKEFEKLREKILEQILYLELEGKERGNDIIDISVNRKDKYKDTKIVSIAFTDMKKLGVDVVIYDIIEEHKKNTQSLDAESIS